MNIVIISVLLPYPLDSGGAQAQFNIIDKLRAKHNITFVFPENSLNKINAMQELQKLWPNVTFKPYRFLAQLTDFFFFFDKIVRAFNLKFRANNDRFKIERILKPYGFSLRSRFRTFLYKIISDAKADVVQIEFYPFLELVDSLPENVLKVFVHHEIRYVRNERMLLTFDLTESEKQMKDDVKNRELLYLNKYDRVVTLTQIDKNELESQGVNVPIYVSPAAVNSKCKQYLGWNGVISFLGAYVHTPNKEGMDWFINDVLPMVDFVQSDKLTLDIIGKGWPIDYEKNTENCNIKLCGFKESLSDAIGGTIMIIPILSGSGMRMKILEAAALGVPFITTSIGVEGLEFRHGESCLVADTAESFAELLSQLTKDEKLRLKLTKEATRIFEKYYSVESLSKVRDKVYM